MMSREESWLLAQEFFSFILWDRPRNKIVVYIRLESRNRWSGKRNVIEQGIRDVVKGPPSYHQIYSIMAKSQHIWTYLRKSVSPYQSARRKTAQQAKWPRDVLLLVLPITNYLRHMVALTPEAGWSFVN